jgi:hypothetical protein
MPLDIVDCTAVVVEDACGGQDLVGFGEVVDVPVRVSQMRSWYSKKATVVPNTDSLVLTTGSQLSFEVGVPVETEALLFMTLQLDLGVDLGGLWHGRVFCAVKDESVSLDGHGCDEVWILRHVAGFVDLAGVVDLLDDIEGDGLFGSTVATDLLLLSVVVVWVDGGLVGEVY